MKPYPSILRATGQAFREIPAAFLFDKLDGSDLRFEWTAKRGWHRAGTRHRLFDVADPEFGEALGLFAATLAEPLAAIARRERWPELVAYVEFAGEHSFAGLMSSSRTPSR